MVRIVKNGWLLVRDFILRTAWRHNLQRLRSIRRWTSIPIIGTRCQMTVRHLVAMAFLEQWILLFGDLLILYEAGRYFVIPVPILILTLALKHLLLSLFQKF